LRTAAIDARALWHLGSWWLEIQDSGMLAASSREDHRATSEPAEVLPQSEWSLPGWERAARSRKRPIHASVRRS